MRAWSRGAAVSIAALALLAVAALAGRAILEPPKPRTPLPPASVASPAFPSAEPAFDVQLPLTTTEVVGGRPVTIEGTGPRQVAYRVAGASPVVARIECVLCSGLLTVASGDRPAPLFDGTAPWSGEYLFNTDPADRETLLRLDAVGRWTVTLTDAGDLTSGATPVVGSGSRVVRLDGPASRATVSAAGGGSVLVVPLPGSAAAGSPTGRPTSVPITGSDPVVSVDLPALVAVEAAGEWAITVP